MSEHVEIKEESTIAVRLASKDVSAALKQSAQLAREVDSALRQQEHVDPSKLHERITY